MAELQGGYDVVIVGGGLAGASAALRATDAGLRCLLIEARGRLGGRAYSRPLTPGGDVLEFGGGWLTPRHDRMQRLAARFDTALRPTLPVVARRWHDGTQLRLDAPVGPEARAAFDRTIDRLRQDALSVKQGGAVRRDSATLAEYLTAIAAAPEAIPEIMAWWTICGSGDPERVAVADLHSSASHIDGTLDGMLAVLTHTVEGGLSTLVSRMITTSGCDVIMGDAVALVRDTGVGIVARLSSGRDVTARRAIVAVPLNTLKSLRFDPPLPDRQASHVARGHLGRAIKILMQAEGVEPGILATGGQGGVRWMLSERRMTDGSVAIIGFALYDDWHDPSRAEAEQALARFFPEARLLAFDWHDWVRDPWSSGTWVSPAPGQLALFDPGTWAGHPRLSFATSDISPHEAGWFEGAVFAGEQAAEAAIAALKP
jgi:monoamine oxidase